MIGYQVANQLRVAANSQMRQHKQSTGDSPSSIGSPSSSPSPSPSPKLSNQLGEAATSADSYTGAFHQHSHLPHHQLDESTMIGRALIKRECEAATAVIEQSFVDNNNNNSVHLLHRFNNIQEAHSLVDRKLSSSPSLHPSQEVNRMSAHLLQHHHHHQHQQQQHHHHLHPHHPGNHRNHSSTSPGYHSAASSPCSTADSPVSSSSSSGVSSSGGTSSGNNNHPMNNQSAVGSNGAQQHQQIKQQTMQHQLVSPFHLLDYFPDLSNDGLNLTWVHEANSRAKLGEALASNKLIIAGDIALAEMSRYPVPIMARAPVGVSDLTLENWVQEVSQAQPQRAIKLTFTSTRTVEPAFRVLARHAESLRGPLILSADILSRTTTSGANNGKSSKQQQQTTENNQNVDAWTFLMMCRTRFPKCTISIGWSVSDIQQLAATNEPHYIVNDPTMTLNNETATQNHRLHQGSNEDQLFDLDMMIDSHPALSQLVDVSHLGHLQHHLGHHLPQQQNRHIQLGHQHPMGINHQHSKHPININQHHRHNSRLHHHHLHHLAAHQLIGSSVGSLSSSSDNSSGSPSPTSPISQLLTPTYQIVAANLSLTGNKSSNQQQQHQLEQTEQLLLSACARNQQAANGGQDAAAAAAAAAAMTAALVAASKLHQQQQQQIPLNLNINEADQQQISSLNALTASARQANQMRGPSSGGFQQSLAQVTSDSLASRLFGSNGSNNNNCGHIQKKLALGDHSMAVSNRACSPQSSYESSKRRTSPKLNGSHQDANLLLKTTGFSVGTSNVERQPKTISGGYTREMIDKMANIVKEYNLTQPVTFPVEARCLLRNQSLSELQRLLYQVGSNSSLTIVAQQDDLIGVDDLLLIRRSFAANQLLFDIPDRLASALKRELD